MLKNPRLYLYLLAGWLLLTNFAHTFLGIPALKSLALDPSAGKFEAFAAMNAQPAGGYFQYNIFDLFFLGMLGLSLFLLFGALVSLWVAIKGNAETVAQFSLLNFLFWALALIASVRFHPVDNFVVIVGGAWLVSAIVLWRARAASAARV